LILDYFKRLTKHLNDSTSHNHAVLETLNDLNGKIETLGQEVKGLKALQEVEPVVESPNNLVVSRSDLVEQKEGILQIDNAVHNVADRLEFVREELMFELRVKTGSFKDKTETVNIESKVLSSDKYDSGIRRINVGCGHVQIDGYINVDAREIPGVDIISSASELPFKDGELEEIYCAHLAEHFTELELKKIILPHWFSKIREGGQLHIVVPDAHSMIKDYIAGEMSFEDLRKVTYGAQDYEGDFHYTMFTTDSLTQLLIEAGFDSASVVEDNRKNGLCREMELIAQKV
jgi:predicted SAM-dependent methyltransferase